MMFMGIQSPVSGDGAADVDSLTIQSKVPGRPPLTVDSHTTTFFGVVDEIWKYGYNMGNVVPSEPQISIRFETNYQVVHKGGQVRTTEHYLQVNGPQSQVAGGVAEGQSRPWFWAFSPNDVSGGRSGELAYGYLQTGKYRINTSGGGGLTITAGDENSSGGVMAFDVDGAHVQKALLAQSPEPVAIASATTGANAVLTFAVTHAFEPGSNLTLFAYAGGEWTPVVVTDVTGVSGLSVTTNLDNSGAAYLPASPAAGSYGARLPHDVANQIVASRLGVGRAIRSGDTDRLSVAGPASFFGKTYYVSPGRPKSLFGAARMGFSTTSSEFQQFSFSNGSAGYAFGYLSGNSATYGFGAGQSTDSNFTSGNSIITFDAANQSVGIGGTIANNGSFLRVRGGTAAKASIHINNQADGSDPPAPSGGVVIYAKAGALFARGSSGTITMIAAA